MASAAQAVGKYAANKMLKKQMKQYQSKNVESGADPYFAMVENPRHPGKFKKVKKQVPAYIPEHDAAVLARVRRNAYRLDMCLFNLLGIRFGWEAVIGIIPVAGDAAGVLLALLLFRECCKIEGGLSRSAQTRMLLNIALDFGVGLIPVLGDLADAAFKCNTRNLRVLERVLDQKYKPADSRRDPRADVGGRGGVDREKRRQNRASGLYTHDDPPPATAFEDFSDEELAEQNLQQQQQQQQPPRNARRSWFGRGGGGGGSGQKYATKEGTVLPTQNDVPMSRTGQETGTVRR